LIYPHVFFAPFRRLKEAVANSDFNVSSPFESTASFPRASLDH
jgi:hypothetical protein